jgi:amino acid transporter
MSDGSEPAAASSAASSLPASPLGLARVLGLADIVAINIVAVIGVRWITRGARVGAPSITLWVLAWLAFFVPLAAAVSELSSRYPDQGGIYVWARRAFGPLHGFVCGWCVWVNNLFYFPALLLFAAANAAVMLGRQGAGLAESRWYSVLFVLVCLWGTTLMNIRGFSAGRWLQNSGSFASWTPIALLIVAGIVSLLLFGSATSFAPHALIPREDVLSTVSLWSAMCFAFAGFEISSFSSAEVRDPRRTIPMGILIAGVFVTLAYIAGSVAVLVTMPASALAERSGIADAVELAASRLGLVGVGVVTAALVSYGSIAGMSSWAAGSARVSFAAGLDNVMPSAMARLHARYRTPHVALIVQAAISTVILLVSVFLTLSGSQTTVQEAYDILVNLTIIVYFVPYLYLFVALVRLRRLDPLDPDDTQTLRVPGGRTGVRIVATLGFIATLVSLALVFVPPSGTTNVVNYEGNILLQSAAVLGVGLALYGMSRTGRARSARSPAVAANPQDPAEHYAERRRDKAE